MPNPEHLAIFSQGKDAWNDWRAKNSTIVPDLKGVYLVNRPLRGFDLRKVDLSDAKLYGADLTGARLEGANLKGADLGEARLTEANLWDATLSQADFTGTVDLLPGQLAGADLRGARIPDSALQFETRSQVEKLSTNAGQLFISMLAGSLLSWVTIESTQDIQFVTGSGTSPLPYAGQSISTIAFYWICPVLLLGAYIYLHLYLQRLWDALSVLPAHFPDGTPLDRATYPWLMNGLVRAYCPRLQSQPILRFSFQRFVTVMVGWVAVPVTLLSLWARYLCRHDLTGSCLHIVILVIAIITGVRSYLFTGATLAGRNRELAILPPFYRNPSIYRAALGSLIIAAALLGLTLLLIDWSGRLKHLHLALNLPEVAEISTKPPNWQGGLKDDSAVVGADLRDRDIRSIVARRAFLVMADLEGARCQDADLSGANLRRSNLAGVHLEGAHLSGADLRGAPQASGWQREDSPIGTSVPGVRPGKPEPVINLAGSDLEYAKLSDADLPADLENVDLTGARLTGAIVSHAILKKIDLTSRLAEVKGASAPPPDLTNIDLSSSDLSGAQLSYANLTNANLGGSTLVGAKLLDAVLIGADLTKARLTGAHLNGADLTRAKISHAILFGADLSPDVAQPTTMTDVDLTGADLRQTSLAHAAMQRVTLNGAIMTGADLSHADLQGAHLVGALLSFSTLVGANLSGGTVERANLIGVDLSDAILARVSLEHALLSGASLTGAHLQLADLKAADLSGADLSGADLTGADLSAAENLPLATLTGVRLDRSTKWPKGFHPPAPAATVSAPTRGR